MFVQTEVTPNPNSLKFLPGKNVSNSGPYEITNKDQINNELVKNILSVNGVEGVFLGKDFISVNGWLLYCLITDTNIIKNLFQPLHEPRFLF